MNAAKMFGLIWLTVLALIFSQAQVARGADSPATNSPPSFAVKITGSGRPMILIPGLSCGGDVWDGTVAHFKDHFECHVLTLAGFAGQPAIGSPFLTRVRSDLAKYIHDKKLDHPIIVGHSLGGFMAFWIASTIPEQVGPVIAVDGLPFLPAVFTPGATADSSRAFAEMYRDQFNSQTKEMFLAANRKSLESMITEPKDVESVNASSKNSDPKAVGQAFYELMTTDLRPVVKSIKSPVLLLGATAQTEGEQRTTVENIYRDQVAPIAKHQVVFAPKARHFIQLDEPEFFYAQVESFLKENHPADTK